MLKKVLGRTGEVTTSVKPLKMRALEVSLTTSRTVELVSKLSTTTNTPLHQREESTVKEALARGGR